MMLGVSTMITRVQLSELLKFYKVSEVNKGDPYPTVSISATGVACFHRDEHNKRFELLSAVKLEDVVKQIEWMIKPYA